jgi:hypothetical protein
MTTQPTQSNQGRSLICTEVALDSTNASLDLPGTIEILKYVYPSHSSLRSQLRNQAGETILRKLPDQFGNDGPQF